MRSAYLQQPSDRCRAPLSRRAIALLLALAAHILIVILLLRLTPNTPPPEKERAPVLFRLLPEPPAPKPAPRAKSVTKVKRASGGASPKAPTAPAKPARTPPPPPVPFPAMLNLDLASSDISKIHAQPGDHDSEGTGTGSGKDSGSAYGPGEGPGGERLYNAEWYREPTDAELNGYLPGGAPPGGWALIACKTVENYRVENCRSLGESPIGSGLSRAMREAAWQFRVLPPRVGGRKMVGAWVRIRIDFTRTGIK